MPEVPMIVVGILIGERVTIDGGLSRKIARILLARGLVSEAGDVDSS